MGILNDGTSHRLGEGLRHAGARSRYQDLPWVVRRKRWKKKLREMNVRLSKILSVLSSAILISSTLVF